MAQANLPIMHRALPDDWVARCPVCNVRFAVRHTASPESPSKSGTFCPDCQANKLMAPGVLNWVRREDLETKLSQECHTEDFTPVA